MSFAWEVEPDVTAGDPGVGTLNFDTVNRRRDRADLVHVVYLPGPIWAGTPSKQGGQAIVTATALTTGGAGSGSLGVNLEA